MSDTDLAPRLQSLLPQVVEIICEMAGQVNYPTYFEFMVEFVKFYSSVLGPYILQILSTIINRIMMENAAIAKAPGEASHSVMISKCWNIIRSAVYRQEY